MDWTQILTAILAFAASLSGALIGNVEKWKSTLRRLDRIEGKLDSHNHYGERLGKVEVGLDNVCKRVDKLEKK